jgi:hypothetical protein
MYVELHLFAAAEICKSSSFAFRIVLTESETLTESLIDNVSHDCAVK